MVSRVFHSGLVAEDAAFGALARRVDCKYGEFATAFEHMESEHIDRRAFACSGYAGDAYAAGIA